MKLLTFRGGVHPDDCKGRTRDAAIKGAALPGRVLIPLEQNTGSPPRVVVKPGQYVRTGETIAEPSAAISVPLHASISGTVAAIRTIPVPYGGTGEAVEIEGDGKDARAWGGGVADPLRMNGSEIIRAVRDA
ncbi:MAG: hypothetical protein NT045_01480, partial [Candidatus Aureabacteria bacterium]|nr:hypothetical protein [Candidatus Auribacterota bacterium]